MSYLFESLGDERFQQLCQAILLNTFPNLQCLPVGQPDGGRDAIHRRRKSRASEKFIVFQVKFVRDPNSREAREAVAQAIQSERAKVNRLIARGASAYYLLTNVGGTSHLDTGSIDKLNADLANAFKIDAHCWWRDDIARRLDGLTELRWSYPEIVRATDLLPLLIEKLGDPDSKRRANVVRA
jgi:hypothetical protein